MIRRHRGELIAECDGCGEIFAGGCQEDFSDFVNELKDDGWKIVRSENDDGEGNGGYEHYCESCR